MITDHPVQALSSFYVPWFAAAAAALNTPGPGQDMLVVHFEGMELPVVQLVLAVAGVLMARPLAPRREPPLGFAKSLLVTVIMLILAVAWVAEARPGILFSFVVSIGLGFSGYALIELAGREIEAFVKRIFAAATSAIDTITGKSR